jgi:8-oxo-dGTP diphosphatase
MEIGDTTKKKMINKIQVTGLYPSILEAMTGEVSRLIEKPKKQRYNYCPGCGGKLAAVPLDHTWRLKCTSCNNIFYENPAVGVAAIILDQDHKLLLGRRKRGKFKGLWCIPCGYLEYDEDIYDSVKRELKEETNLDIEAGQVFSVKSNSHDPHQRSVGIWFKARIIGGELKPGDDLCELDYFPLDNLPSLAFPTDKMVIDELRTKQRDVRDH